MTPCAFCGQAAELSTMDMTGKGPRYRDCSLRSLAAGQASMAEHLSGAESAFIAAQGRRKIFLGAGLLVLGVALLIFFFSAGRIPIYLVGAPIVGGIASLATGVAQVNGARRR